MQNLMSIPTHIQTVERQNKGEQGRVGNKEERSEDLISS